MEGKMKPEIQSHCRPTSSLARHHLEGTQNMGLLPWNKGFLLILGTLAFKSDPGEMSPETSGWKTNRALAYSI